MDKKFKSEVSRVIAQRVSSKPFFVGGLALILSFLILCVVLIVARYSVGIFLALPFFVLGIFLLVEYFRSKNIPVDVIKLTGHLLEVYDKNSEKYLSAELADVYNIDGRVYNPRLPSTKGYLIITTKDWTVKTMPIEDFEKTKSIILSEKFR